MLRPTHARASCRRPVSTFSTRRAPGSLLHLALALVALLVCADHAHAQLSGVVLTTSASSPQSAGTSIVLSASASGGSGHNLYRFWIQPWGGGWQLVRDWSAASSYTWTPGSAGGYNLSVEAYDSASSSAQVGDAVGFTIVGGENGGGGTGGGGNGGQGGQTMSGVALTTSLQSPQPSGTTIVLSASGSGGSGPYAYRFWSQPWGGSWTMLQDWSSASSYAWSAAPGGYSLSVEARGSASNGAEVQAATNFEFTGSGGGGNGGGGSQPMTGVSLAASVPSPQAPGTSILVSAAGSGGTAPYSYRFWVQPHNGSWSIVQDWSTSSSYWWQPSTGNYNVAVEARGSAASTGEVQAAMGYVITSGGGNGGGGSGPISCGPFNVGAQSPQPAGAAIPLSISCTGDNLLYYFKLQHWGSEAFTIIQDWGPANSVTWRPTTPGGYNLWAEVRRASSTQLEVKIGVGFEIR